jgi:hypothetical protein
MSFVIGGGGGWGECDEKILLHFAPSLLPKADICALEASVHKTTYGPLIGTAFCCGLIHYLGKWDGVWPWKSGLF